MKIFGLLDSSRFDTSSIGSGLGGLVAFLGIGYITHLVMVVKPSSDTGFSNVEILDADITSEHQEAIKERITYRLRPY